MRFDEGLEAAEVLISQQATAIVTIVAVDGHSAAGKSAFADRLSQRVDASIVHGDDFYRVMDDSERERLTAQARRRRVLRLAADAVRGIDAAAFWLPRNVASLRLGAQRP